LRRIFSPQTGNNQIKELFTGQQFNRDSEINDECFAPSALIFNLIIYPDLTVGPIQCRLFEPHLSMHACSLEEATLIRPDRQAWVMGTRLMSSEGAILAPDFAAS
jgi:hypothetical protein